MSVDTNESLAAAAQLAQQLEEWRSAGADSASVVIAIARLIEAITRPPSR